MKKEAMLYERVEGDKVRCRLCSHQCTIAEGKFGFCGVRRNTAGTLYTMVFGEAIARNVDPIEKKPLYHFLPGSRSLSIATVGCNFHCGFCQNWQISQISQRQEESAFEGHWFPPEAIVEEAKGRRCASISYTYTEPTIFFEYAYETAALSRESNIRNVFVTNGYMSRRALDTMAPYLDAANVDLKAWREAYYKTVCKAHLEPVLDTIRHMKELGIWLEVTTLIVPGENDSDEQLEGIGRFIAEVGVETPWHISRFYPNYQFSDRGATPLETLERAKAIGTREGLRYVYLGNVPADTRTYCHRCNEVVITRDGDGAKGIKLKNGKCPGCGAEIDGVWE
jgi:pyruvate formate lyase activating enzyme